jgi:hypothetical protein
LRSSAYVVRPSVTLIKNAKLSIIVLSLDYHDACRRNYRFFFSASAKWLQLAHTVKYVVIQNAILAAKKTIVLKLTYSLEP